MKQKSLCPDCMYTVIFIFQNNDYLGNELKTCRVGNRLTHLFIIIYDLKSSSFVIFPNIDFSLQVHFINCFFTLLENCFLQHRDVKSVLIIIYLLLQNPNTENFLFKNRSLTYKSTVLITN